MEIIQGLSENFTIEQDVFKCKSITNLKNQSKLFSFEIESEMIDDNVINDLIFEKDDYQVKNEEDFENYDIEYDKLIFEGFIEKENQKENKKGDNKAFVENDLENEEDVLANVDVKEFNNLILNYSDKDFEHNDTNCNTRMTLFSIAGSPKNIKDSRANMIKHSFSDLFKNFIKGRKCKANSKNSSKVSSPNKTLESVDGAKYKDANPTPVTPIVLRRKRRRQIERGKSFSFQENNGEIYMNISDIKYTNNTDNPANDLEQSKKISIVSYNILNQIYMKKSNREDLSLENRMKTVIIELKNLNADIICLQEADIRVLKTYITHKLPDYNFVYGVNCGSSFINVIGYNKEKFRLISFKNFSLLSFKVVGNRGAMNVILERNSTNRENISIYNVHFPWRHELQRCEILEMLLNNVIENNIDRVIMAGDFNSEPNSIPIKLIYFDHYVKENLYEDSNRIFDFSNRFDLTNIWKEDKFVLFENVYRKFRLKSAYENYKKYLKFCKNEDCFELSSNKKIFSSEKKKLRVRFRKHKKISKNPKDPESSVYLRNELKYKNFKNHPEMTTCTAFYKNTIDYILHSKKLKLNKILKLPESNEIMAEDYLPSMKYPSDHLKIFAEFGIV